MSSKRRYSALFVVILLLAAIVAASLINQAVSNAESNINITIEPDLTVIKKGDFFTLNVILNAGTAIKLDTWQVALAYNSTFLNCTGVWIPEENVFAGRTIAPIEPEIVPEHGYVLYGASLMGGDIATVEGKNTLFQMNFSAIEKGQARIEIGTSEHKIPVYPPYVEWYSYIGYWDDAMNFVEIPFVAQDGLVIVEMKAPPIIYFTVSTLQVNETTFYLNETIMFNASRSYDVDGYIVNYTWNFGDGNTTVTADPVITHMYRDVGYFFINLTATDNDGLSSSRTRMIPVDIRIIPLDMAPIANTSIIVISIIIALAVINKVVKWKRSKTIVKQQQAVL